MIEHLPVWINIIFILAVLFTIFFLYVLNGRSKKLLATLILWSMIHSCLAYTGFYLPMDTGVPRFVFVLLPTILFIIYALRPSQIEWMHQHRDLNKSTFLHTVRIVVEIVLLYLFINKMVPELMTFEGRNFDILAGLTAPIIGYLFINQNIGLKVLLIWNVIGLCLVLFVLINGILSAELPIQQFGFDQPSKAITYFPFILLPAVVVPIVVYTHVTDIIHIIKLRAK